jgi:hypothetical protein
MSQNATGTHTGHAIGAAFNNGWSYVAGGGLEPPVIIRGPNPAPIAVTNRDRMPLQSCRLPSQIPTRIATKAAMTIMIAMIVNQLMEPILTDTS